MTLEHATSVGRTLGRAEPRLELGGYVPGMHSELSMSGGFSRRQPVGAAQLSWRIQNGVVLTGRWSRDDYTSTVASLDAAVLFATARAQLHLDRRNWIGEAAIYTQRFDDDNSIFTTYGWLLAPLAHTRAVLLQGGYAVSWQDATQSRFVGPDYQPYFTPERELTHSLAGSLMLGSPGSVRLQLNGSYAIHAERDVPSLQGAQRIVFSRQSFQPYSAHAGLTLPLTADVVLNIDGEQTRTAFYRFTRGGASFTWRIGNNSKS